MDGSNIYLTIDSNIQRFAETEVKAIEEKYEPEWLIISVMDAKTGDILASHLHRLLTRINVILQVMKIYCF
ncbi:MAG: hypothetical protein V8R01_06035 [Bacilli bacterium]